VTGVHAVVIPLGGANFGSLWRACERVGVRPEFSVDPVRIAAASHVILPGVGAAGPAMQALRAHDLDRWLPRLRQPILGICLGMQLLYEASAEGDTRTLGLLPGQVERLAPAPVWPHMGWNTVAAAPGHPLLDGIDGDSWFYFVHGFAAPVSSATVASTRFGEPFTAVASLGNVHGTQFHPEKSADAGRRLLANFFAL
jgi:glutamine amidotransferase